MNTNESVIGAVRQMRNACTVTVTRQEIDWDAYGASLALLREDSGIPGASMAHHIGISSEELSHVENGAGVLNLHQQVKFVRLCLEEKRPPNR